MSAFKHCPFIRHKGDGYYEWCALEAGHDGDHARPPALYLGLPPTPDPDRTEDPG